MTTRSGVLMDSEARKHYGIYNYCLIYNMIRSRQRPSSGSATFQGSSSRLDFVPQQVRASYFPNSSSASKRTTAQHRCLYLYHRSQTERYTCRGASLPTTAPRKSHTSTYQAIAIPFVEGGRLQVIVLRRVVQGKTGDRRIRTLRPQVFVASKGGKRTNC